MNDRTILPVEHNPDDEESTRRAFGQETLDYLFCQGVYATRDPRHRC